MCLHSTPCLHVSALQKYTVIWLAQSDYPSPSCSLVPLNIHRAAVSDSNFLFSFFSF